MAKTYRVVQPLVVVKTTAGTYVHVYDGAPLPADADPAHLKQLVAEGYVAETDSQADSGDATEDKAPSPNSTAGILAAVGDDVDKATAALAAEHESAKPRKGLIEKLEEIITKPAGGDGSDDGSQS